MLLRVCDVQTIQTKFARFWKKKFWLLYWTPQRFGKIDAPGGESLRPSTHLVFFFRNDAQKQFNTHTHSQTHNKQKD